MYTKAGRAYWPFRHTIQNIYIQLVYKSISFSSTYNASHINEMLF